MAEETGFLTSLGRNPPSFDLVLDEQPDTPLHCRRVVRALPGKRLVCAARWRGQRVFAKLYFGPGHRRHWRREVDGLQALSDADIDCPATIHAGTADHGRASVILLEAIEPSETLGHALESANEAGRRGWVCQAAVVLAQMHRAGLEQQDPHPNNFLTQGKTLFTLDGGTVSIHARALGSRRSLGNLALLLASLPAGHDHLTADAFGKFCALRGWPAERLQPALERRISAHRRRRLKKRLEKIFRDCSAYVCRQQFDRFTVYRRSDASAALEALLADPDASRHGAQARLLKDGNTCTVWSVPSDRLTLVIKRYNIKNIIHGLSRAWRRSRAAVSWENAHLLEFHGIATPRPVALVEERLGPLRRRAYFITEAVEGENVIAFLHRCRRGSPQEEAVIQRVSELLGRLAALYITHGDLKGSNIILGPDGPVIIDLDALREHDANAGAFERLHRKDIRRFQDNWKDRPELDERFGRALRTLGIGSG